MAPFSEKTCVQKKSVAFPLRFLRYVANHLPHHLVPINALRGPIDFSLNVQTVLGNALSRFDSVMYSLAILLAVPYVYLHLSLFCITSILPVLR